MKSFFSLLLTIVFFSLKPYGQEPRPYNEDLYFKVINENEIVPHVDSLKAIVFVRKGPTLANAKQSILNNPQLKEIKLFNPTQDFIDLISELKLDSLTHLFIEDYNRTRLVIPPLSTLEHLSIKSSRLTSLSTEIAFLQKLDILDIDAPELIDWKSEKYFPSLGLIELNAPKLGYFPIEQMPNVSQFSFYCSFSNLPANLCSYKELKCMSFENYKPIDIDKCMKKKIKKGVFSNITVYDKMGGQIILEIESMDRKNFFKNFGN